MAADNILKETKSIISSLIISSSKSLTVRQLRKDYWEEVGQDVPFRQLGFDTIERFLQSIPETCLVNGHGDWATVVPVINEKVKHLNDMIMKQKPTKSKMKGPKRSRGVINHVDANAKFGYQQNYTPTYNTRVKFTKPLLPNNQIRPVPNLANNQNKSVPLLANNQNKPVPLLANNQNKPVPLLVNNQIRPPLLANNQTTPVPLAINQIRPVPLLANNPNKPVPLLTNYQNKPVPSFANVQNKPNPEYANNQKQNHIDVNHKKPNPTYTNNCKQNLTNYTDSQSSVANSDNSSGKENVCHSRSACSQNSFSSDQYCSDLDFSDEIYISDDENIDSVLNLEDLNIADDCAGTINKNIRRKIRDLIAEHPDGIWCSQLLQMYKEKWKQDLNLHELGFTSVIQFCGELSSILHCVRPSRMDWIIFDKRHPIPDLSNTINWRNYELNVSTNPSNSEPPIPENMYFPEQNLGVPFPEDVVQMDEQIDYQWLMNDEDINDYIEVVVAEVYDPSKFWIQLRSEFEALTLLMDNMQLFYQQYADKYKVPHENIQLGLFCTTLFMQEYHRAKVVRKFEDNTVKVFYIDYGTIDECSFEKIFYLHEDFACLPQQAIRARLANILPAEPNTMWPRRAAYRMLEMVTNRNLVACLQEINYDMAELSLILTDTNLPDIDIHINDVLVNENFAVIGKEAPLCETSSAVVPNVHLYPTFEELETAQYPCFTDLKKLLKLGQTYEVIYYNYFDHSTDKQKSLDKSLPESPQTKKFTVPPGFEHFNSSDIRQNIENNAKINLCGPESQEMPKISTPIEDESDYMKFMCKMDTNFVNPFILQQLYHNMEQTNFMQKLTMAQYNYLQNTSDLRDVNFSQIYNNFKGTSGSSNTNISHNNKPYIDTLGTSDINVSYVNKHNPEPQSSLKEDKLPESALVYKARLESYDIHIINVEGIQHILTQEIITKLLGSTLSFNQWIKSRGLNLTSFPCKIINLLKHRELYNEIKMYDIPGLYAPTNLGCNIRVTMLEALPAILEQYGDKCITNKILRLFDALKKC